MSTGLILLNAAYFVYALSAVFKEMFALRVTLLVASGFYIAYGLVEPNWSVFLWNIPVGILHSYGIWKLLQQRRGIHLDEEADAIRTLLFPDLNRIAFNEFWHAGNERIVTDEVLISEGAAVSELMLILDGEVDVIVGDDVLVRLGRLRMLGEMSSMSGEGASATVTAAGEVRLRCWNKTKLTRVGETHTDVQTAVLKAIGLELTRKLK